MTKVGDTSKIRVLYGTVNGTEPTGMSPGDTPPFLVLPAGDAGYIYLIVTVDEDYVVNSRTIGIGAAVPPDTTTAFCQQIGSYSVETSEEEDEPIITLAQAISGSQAFELCGGVSPLWGLV